MTVWVLPTSITSSITIGQTYESVADRRHWGRRPGSGRRVGRRPTPLGAAAGVGPLCLDVEADVEDRCRVGEGADRCEVDAGRGVGGDAVEVESARYLEQGTVGVPFTHL